MNDDEEVPESFGPDSEEPTAIVRVTDDLLFAAMRDSAKAKFGGSEGSAAEVAAPEPPALDQALALPESDAVAGLIAPEIPEPIAKRAPRENFERAKRVLSAVTWWGLELGLVAAVIGAVLAYRLLHLEPIEVGGDALKVWEFARQLAHGGGLPEKFNHHTSRFGNVIPALLSQKIFGSGATTYYIAPLGASVVLHTTLYLIGRRLSGPLAGTIAVALLLGFAPMERASSQILPETFGPMYVALSYYAAILHADAERRWSRGLTLVLAGGFMFAAYGAKIVYLYYAPGLAFLIWFGREPAPEVASQVPVVIRSRLGRVWHFAKTKGLLIPGFLTLVVLGLLIAEAVFMKVTTDAAGRFIVETTSHGISKKSSVQIREFADFFALYRRAPAEWDQALFAGVVAGLGTLAYGRDRRTRLYALALLIYVLLQTFILRSFKPLVPWMEPHPRYLIALAAPLALVIGLFFSDVANKIWQDVRTRVKWGAGSTSFQSGLGHVVAISLGALILSGAVADLPKEWEKKWGKSTNWERTKRTERDLTQAFKAGIPIVSSTPLGKPAWAAAVVYVDHRLMMEGGKLLSYGAFSQNFGRGRFVARAVHEGKISRKQLGRLVQRRVRDRRCAIVLTQRARYAQGSTRYQKDCVPLGQEPKGVPKAKPADAKK